MLFADFDEAVVIAVFVDVALGVTYDDSDFFVGAGATENVVQGIEYVCFSAERFACFAELFNARARRNRFAARTGCNFAATINGFAARGCDATARRNRFTARGCDTTARRYFAATINGFAA